MGLRRRIDENRSTLHRRLGFYETQGYDLI
jgi:hypothetical protein